MSEPTILSTVTLREVTEENLPSILKLKVDEAQEQFVAPNAISISQAYFAREKAWFRAICAGDTPVGFLMLSDEPDKAEYFLWRLMIDGRYQGMNFGRQAMELLIQHVKTRPNALELKTSYVPKEGGPGPFYAKLGFKETGEILEDEVVTSLKLVFDEGESPAPGLENDHDQILALLQKFQDGYSQRDPAYLDPFMELFGPDEELEVIGTNAVRPGDREWCRGTTVVRNLIKGDWEGWGDVVYDLLGAQIFILGDVAWIATTATVSDVITANYKYNAFVEDVQTILDDQKETAKSKLLEITRVGNLLISSMLLPEAYVWPLRFTAVAQKTNSEWRFHQMHFSFATIDYPDVRLSPDQ